MTLFVDHRRVIYFGIENHRIEKVNKSLHQFEQHVTTAQKYRMVKS
jgi:hypothetical protein